MLWGVEMKRFIEGEDRSQVTLLPECLDDYIGEDNPAHVVDAFVDELDLGELGFDGVTASLTRRPGYHPAVLLKLYIYGYLNRIQSSRRLERECQRNIELMWLTSRLSPDFKTIADFRKNNGKGIRNVCRRFVAMCRQLKLFSEVIVAIDGSKFKAVNNWDKNYTQHKLEQLPTKADVHNRRSAPRQTLGARASSGHHASASGQESWLDATARQHGGARLWDDQVLDGVSALADERLP
jgi:transposase